MRTAPLQQRVSTIAAGPMLRTSDTRRESPLNFRNGPKNRHETVDSLFELRGVRCPLAAQLRRSSHT
jgi:hypothetical protein